MANKKLRATILGLRQDGCSYGEIAKKLEISKSHVAYYAKDTKLTPLQILAKLRAAASKGGRAEWKPDCISNMFKLFGARVDALSSTSKGRAAEAAVRFRLSMLNLEVLGGTGGESIDFLVMCPHGQRIIRLQVRWAYKGPSGAPRVRLRCSAGRGKEKRFEPDSFDILTGYDLITDSVYVWSAKELLEHKTTITVCAFAHEAWSKLLNLLE